MSPEERAEMKTLIREAVAEELDERMRRSNLEAIEREQAYWWARVEAGGLG